MPGAKAPRIGWKYTFFGQNSCISQKWKKQKGLSIQRFKKYVFGFQIIFLGGLWNTRILSKNIQHLHTNITWLITTHSEIFSRILSNLSVSNFCSDLYSNKSFRPLRSRTNRFFQVFALSITSDDHSFIKGQEVPVSQLLNSVKTDLWLLIYRRG